MARSNGAGRRRSRVGRGQRWSAAEKARYLAEFAASGLSGAAFVRQTGLPQSTFDVWRSEARRREVSSHRSAREKAGASRFARVELMRLPSPSGITLVVRRASGLAAEFGSLDGASAGALLKTVLRSAAR